MELHGWLPRERLVSLFARCSGFIHVGEEDFGITMVEALAAGAPVLAVDRGGARDIVRAGREGVLVSDPHDPAQLRARCASWPTAGGTPKSCGESAERFSEERFRERLAGVLRDHGAS